MPQIEKGDRYRLSVVIPTFNRKTILQRSLQALENQTSPPDQFEVIVVDDGSSDGTGAMVQDFIASCRRPVRYFWQNNKKQGVARNLGSRQAEGRLLLFLGDDIIASPTLVEQHLRYHEERSSAGEAAVLGYIRWAPDLKVTRFMHWIGEMGWQFGFSLITDPMDLPFNFFYTSNISLPRSRFLDCGGFDEDFREYGWEDIELSCRLKDRGMKIIFNREAVAYHYHPTTLASFCQRQITVGYSAWRFYQKHPEMERFLSLHWIPRYPLHKRIFLRGIRLLSEWSERLEFIDTSKYYQDLMSYYYFQGLKRAIDNQGRI
jgi:GT2 family glycosyltransferase